MDADKIVKRLYKITENTVYLEKAIVWSYVEAHGIIVAGSQVLESCRIDKAELGTYLQIKEMLLGFYKYFCIDDLIDLFEHLIPINTKKTKGAVYTPVSIRKFIVEKCLQDAKPVHIIDPACGCGAFLITAAEVMHEKCSVSFSEAISTFLYGVDVDSSAIRKTKILLSLLSRSNGDYEPLAFNLFCSDFLSPKCFELLRREVNSGFEVVIGNPPYVRFRNMEDKSKAYLKNWVSSSAGNVDLYMPFFEVGLKLINEKGKLGYITPNGFIQSVNGRRLRSFLLDCGYSIELLDFRDNQMFKGVTSYTCISFIDKGKKARTIGYTRVDEKNDLGRYSISQYSFDLFSGGSPWRMSDNQKDQIIYALETAGKPLSEWKIRNGLATLKNNVYFFTPVSEDKKYYYRLYNGREYKIEKDVCIKVAKPNIIKNETELIEKIEIAIFPYEYVDKRLTIISESKFIKKYPQAYFFLNETKEELGKRDKGHGNYPEWYAYGRTQGMNNFGKKLLIPYIAGAPTAVLCDDPNILFYCGYALFSDDDEELRILKLFLESDAFWYYIYNTSKPYSKGFMAFAKNYIVRFSIPNLSQKEKVFLLSEKNRKKVNCFIWNKYGLDEMKID